MEPVFFAMFVDADGTTSAFEEEATEIGEFVEAIEFYAEVSHEFNTPVYNDDDTHVLVNHEGDYCIIIGA